MATFYDHFSGHAELYNRHRPTYPDGLFDWLARRVGSQDIALDLATGGGQAALGLTAHFDRVIGVDASIQQILHARSHDRVRYVLASADELPLQADSVDLVTIAQALHWLDRPEVYEEVRRVGRRGGVVAAWSYQLFSIDPAVDAVMHDFYYGVLDEYWPPQRAHIREHYRTLSFPFEEIEAPELSMHPVWERSDLLAQVATWSAVRRHDAATGTDAVAALAPRIEAAWPEGEQREVDWRLNFRIGRI